MGWPPSAVSDSTAVKQYAVKQYSVKQYKPNVFSKKSSQLSKDIYMLPLDIKLIIFKMAMDTHMEEWLKKHRQTSRSWYGLKTRYKPFSWLDLIKGWGIQAPKNKFFPHVHDHYWDNFKGSIPDKYKIKLCRRDNVIKEKNIRHAVSGLQLKQNSKIDILSISAPGYNIFSPFPHHRLSGSNSGRYWVHKKCRCLTCDLIRLYSIKGHNMGYYSYKDMKQKYARIDYLSDGRWETKTISQVKSEAEFWFKNKYPEFIND